MADQPAAHSTPDRNTHSAPDAKAIRKFIAAWKDRGDEKQETQTFWNQLLRTVYGVEDVDDYILYEKPVLVDDMKTGKKTTKFIDGYIPATRVLIEQKGVDIDLDKAYKQSDDSVITPYQQARRYGGYLGADEQPLWIVVCNFRQFNIYNMKQPNDPPEVVLLSDLGKDYARLTFLVSKKNVHIQQEVEVSVKAGAIVGLLYDAFLKQYKNPEDPETLKSLNKLCVRLVFCLYAEDADIFGQHLMFHDYLVQYPTKDMRKALVNLFRVLNQRPEERDPYLADDDPLLAAFPYVNGGLFADEEIEIPPFTDEIRELLLTKASADFDWSSISPTIFGAVFESTLNPVTRRSGGMHYTSIENIHKVIDPLFLDDLKAEFKEISAITVVKTREQKLREFQAKLASLDWLDPAAGSGNFLTETYLCIRRLENDVLRLLGGGQMALGDRNVSPIQVSISQFHGIEINDFAVTVAKTALWIAESQMMKETEDIIYENLEFLPLKTNATIVEGNALRMDWNDVVDKGKLNYIIGNPPFVGYSLQRKSQKEDILSIYVDENGKPYKTAGKIDYVAGWYWKASEMMVGTTIQTALVSTNSITQGEQVAAVWKPLYERFGIHIDFAHRTFRWDSEASIIAHVHCVIVGFSCSENDKNRLLYNGDRLQKAQNINPYLVDGTNVFIEARNKPICNTPILLNGGKPTEGGFLILTEEEKDELLSIEPQAKVFIRPYMMGKDFLQRKPRYCLWLVKANPSDLRRCPKVLERIEKVRNYRLQSPKEATRKKSETPMLFDEVRECTTDYVAIPKVSSENRRYIPMEYLNAEIIPGDKLFMIQGSTLYDFGVLTSNVHMAWMRAVCGRLKSDYSYSSTIVYNNFPWPTPTDSQKQKIEATAQAILDARALYPDSSLADLYDELTMPIELRAAHQANDRAVMAAYGFPKDMPEPDIVAELMKMYEELTAG